MFRADSAYASRPAPGGGKTESRLTFEGEAAER